MDTAPWYYVTADRQRRGPVPAATLRELAAAGSINARTLVWRQGMPQWQALEAMAGELGVALPPLPPPTPPPAPTTTDGEATRVLRPEPGLLDPASTPQAPERGTATDAHADAAVDRAYAAHVGADPQARHTVAGDSPVVYAGFWKRFAANFIDSFIVGMVGGVIGAVIGALFGIAMYGGGMDPAAGTLLSHAMNIVLGVVLGLVYYGGFHSSESQATPGKMLIGIKVARSDGDRLTPMRAGARFLATYLNLFTFGIGWLMAAFTERKQALHDFLCDTVVVDRWAYTEFPERQNEALGGCAVAVLVICGLLILGTFAAVFFFIAALGSGSWN